MRHSITGSVKPEFSKNQNEVEKKKKAEDGKKKAEEQKRAADEEQKKAEAQKKLEEAKKDDDADDDAEEAEEESSAESNESYEIIMYARKVKRIFVVSLTFKICMLIISACVLGFAAESSPNVNIWGCNYNHRPGFVAFFIVVHAFFFCVMVFLMAYQLFYQLKEKARIPQRVMDLFCLIILIIICSIALACYTLWFDDTLSPYYEECQKKEKENTLCHNDQNCEIFSDMRTMAIGAIFWGALLVFVLILGAILLGCVIGRKMMESPEGQALYKKIQEDSDLSIKDAANNDNKNNAKSFSLSQIEDDELGYGGEGLVLLNLDKRKALEP